MQAELFPTARPAAPDLADPDDEELLDVEPNEVDDREEIYRRIVEINARTVDYKSSDADRAEFERLQHRLGVLNGCYKE